MVQFSRTAIDAGADVVIGHGPHVLRAMEIYKGKLIVYSLGNFVVYKLFNVKGLNRVSMILNIEIEANTGYFAGGTLIPLKLDKHGIPEVDPSGEAIHLVGRLSKEDVNGNVLLVENTGCLQTARQEAAKQTVQPVSVTVNGGVDE